MRVLVVTVVHRPDDARILSREIGALVAAGHEVTYAAPFRETGVERPSHVHTIDLPRASGRHRLTAGRIARRMLKLHAAAHDAVIVHDPELLIAAAGLRHPVVVWDVHEDTAAALTLKSWLPSWLRPAVAGAVRLVEGSAERHRALLLAESGYAPRFRREHPVVPNTTMVPECVPQPGPGRAVYIGHLTEARGALDLVEVGRRVSGRGVTVELVGHAHASVEPVLRQAHDAGWIVWRGFLPNEEALALLDGATVGLSLLHDEQNYRQSMPTKVIEYMAHGVPVVTTPLPLAQEIVERNDCGLVVPFTDPEAAAAAVLALHSDTQRRERLGANGHRTAAREFNWVQDGARFVATIQRLVEEARAAGK